MAQSGYTPIQLYYSTTAAAVPVNTNLASGELAINITDGKLYYKNNSGVVTLLAGATSGPAGGSNTQVQYNSSGALAGSSGLTFDGTNLGVGGSSSYKLGVTGSSNNATSGAIQTVNSNAGTGTQTGLWASNGTQSAQFSLAGTGYTAYGAYAAGNAIIYNDQAITLMADNASTGVIKFAAGGNTEGMRLTSTGLGIGTSSPSSWTKLQVQGTAGAQTDATQQLHIVAPTTTAGQGAGIRLNAASGAKEAIGVIGVVNNASGNLGSMTFGVYNAGATVPEYMRLDNSGNLGIGTTSPSTKLHVVNGNSPISIMQSSNGNGGYVEFNNSSTAPLYAGFGQTLVAGITVNDAALRYSNNLVFGLASVEKARITNGFSVGTTADAGGGGIYATGNITAYYSDKRLKTVSGKIENALDKVAQLSGVYYTNNSVAKSFGYDSDEVQVGVLAQDVEAVLPQIVKAAPFDLDEHGNSKSGENYKTVQYERLVPLLIEAINELRAEVKALKGV